jgi:hypothetical protein
MPYKKISLDLSPEALRTRLADLNERHKRAEQELADATANHARASVSQELKGGSRKLFEATNNEKACADIVSDIRRQIIGCETLIVDAAKAEQAASMEAAIRAVEKVGNDRLKVVSEIEETTNKLKDLLLKARDTGKEITSVDHVPSSVGNHLFQFPDTIRQYLDHCFKDIVNGHLVDQKGANDFNSLFQENGLHKVESARWKGLVSEVKAIAGDSA